jgi:hypothetical protein
MKTIKNYKIVAFFLAMTMVLSCVKDDDYDVPNTDPVAPIIDGEIISINALNSLLEQEQTSNGNDILNFTESNLYISGYVISNDEAGNIYEELVIQDSPSNPTRGVKVLIDVSPLYTTYEFGRKVYVKLDGLAIGYNGGVLSLGTRVGAQVEAVAESLMDQTIIREVELATIEAMPINISDFSLAKTNLYVRLNDVQFNRNDALGDNRKTFAAESDDDFDGERNLESCSEGLSVILSTSTFSDFKAVEVPQGRGYLDGILTLNYFGDTFNMVLNSPETINFDNENRCDPETFNCDGPSGGGDEFYDENFEAFDAIESYVSAGWTNVNNSGGSDVWEIGNFSNNNYAQITGYNSGEDVIDSWLVTPAINMDATTEEELNFNIQAAYDNGTILTVLISTDFSGDVTTANWSLLDANIPTGPEGGFGDFVPSGPINISCVDGTAHIAFRYEGSDPSATTRYHIDDIVITGY